MQKAVNVLRFLIKCILKIKMVILLPIYIDTSMNRYFLLVLLVIIQLGFPISGYCQSNENPHPKNIILMIGDGMGITQIQAASATVPYSLNIMRCPHTAIVKTSSADDDVTDSAAAGTAIACGAKTKNNYTGVDSTGSPVKSILKYAEENGLSTGIVVTCDITHATPASFYSHIKNRWESEMISAQLVNSGIEVIIGGGYDRFAKRSDSINYIDSLTSNNYEIIRSLDQLTSNQSDKIAALVYPKHAPKISDGRGEMLPLSTKKAIEVLSKDKDGFFLMVEGSQIDWGGEGNDINYVVNELLDFDKAVGVALDYALKDPETLVIVTADHETGGLALVESEVNKDKMEPKFSTTHHTAAPVGLFAFGKGADNFKGIIENTDIFQKMLSLYGFTK